MSDLPEEHQRTLLAAQGYCELGMPGEAVCEIETVPARWQRHPAVLEMRLIVLMQTKRWPAALTAAQELIRTAPQINMGYIHAAYCLHELGRTDSARDMLLTGPASLHAEPVYYYNLACYQCRLGELESARGYLEKTFALDKKFRDFAKTDPDLLPLRAE